MRHIIYSTIRLRIITARRVVRMRRGQLGLTQDLSWTNCRLLPRRRQNVCAPIIILVVVSVSESSVRLQKVVVRESETRGSRYGSRIHVKGKIRVRTAAACAEVEADVRGIRQHVASVHILAVSRAHIETRRAVEREGKTMSRKAG